VKRIIFIGYGDERYVSFLNSFSLSLCDKRYQLSAVFFSLHNVDAKIKDSLCFSYIDLKCQTLEDSVYFNPELFFDLFKANFYILWNGYHDAYAVFRNYLKLKKIPHLLSEFTGIDGLFHFDSGLNGEASFLSTPLVENSNGFFLENRDKLEKHIKPNYVSLNRKLNLSRERKIVTFFGLWDAAAGLSNYNDESVRGNQSPFFLSSFDACSDLLKCSTNIDVFFVVKPHPCDTAINKERFKELCGSNCYFAEDDVDTFDLIFKSDVVVTINSSLSILAAMLNKPILLLGHTYISKYAYPYKLKHKDDVSFQLNLALIMSNWDFRLESLDAFFLDFISSTNTFTDCEELLSVGSHGVDSLLLKVDNLTFDENTYFDSVLYVKYVFKNIINELEVSKRNIVSSRTWRYTKFIRWFIEKLNQVKK